MTRPWIIVAMIIALFITSYSQTPDWQEVEKIFGRKGAVQGDVLKVSFPRSDLKVKVGDTSIDPAFALTSWIAFNRTGEHSMIMGDLVLLDSEIGSVVAKIAANRLEVTALHNHIIGESPSIKYLHFAGQGDAATLAQQMVAVLSVTGTPLTALQSSQASNVYDWSKVESVLGRQGQRKGNVIQFGIPRSETITENGMVIPPFMGMATGINIQSVGDEAATTGDFVLLASEVNPVVHALTDNGIAVTAIHSHMLFETPRLFFLHFWAVGQPEKLARGLKAVLEKTNSNKQ